MKTLLKYLIWGAILFPLVSFAQNLDSIATKKPLAFSGSLDIRTIGYSAKGIDPRRSPFSYIISGSPTLSVYGIDIPVSFTFSEQDRSFSQPFNQVGLSPTYKWATLHAGYRNVNFSPYTLAGHTILGGGFEVNPGKFRAGFMTGRLNRATSIDTTTGYVRPEIFSRYGTAVKLGYGTETKHVNISFITAKDSERGFKGNLDSSISKLASNIVLGTDFKYEIVKGLSVFGDAAVSIYTKDINSDMKVDLDSTRKGVELLQKLIKLNATSEYYLAYSAGLNYTSNLFSLKAGYKLVEPNFRSMGAYFFQNDLQNITLSPSVRLLNGKMRFNGSIGIQEDNRDRKKEASTKRVISMANLSWDISQIFGFDANFTNFTANSEPTVAVVDNKYLLAQTNQNLSITPRIVLANSSTTQVIILSFNSSSLKDLNEETAGQSDILTSVVFLNYNLTLNQLGLNLSAGVNYVKNKIEIGSTSNQGLSLSASKAFLKNKLQVSTNGAFTQSNIENGKGSIINLGGNIGYAPLERHRISLRVFSISNSSERENTEKTKYSELTGELGYTYSF